MTLFKRNIIATMSLFGILAITVACKTEKSNATVNSQTEKDTLNITVLQTADIHGQLDTHPELFWEDEEALYFEVCDDDIDNDCNGETDEELVQECSIIKSIEKSIGLFYIK